MKAAQAAISANPDDEPARAILATVYWFAGDLAGAIRECELALEQSPNYNLPFAFLGILRCRMEPDQYDRAREFYAPPHDLLAPPPQGRREIMPWHGVAPFLLMGEVGVGVTCAPEKVNTGEALCS